MIERAVFGAASHTGLVRGNNEDEYLFLRSPDQRFVLLILADGMGGHQGGEDASQIAVAEASRVIDERFREDMNDDEILDLIDYAAETANINVELESRSNPAKAGMGTTFTCGIIARNRLFIGHVGDTRIYLLRQGRLLQLTTDHTYVQTLVDRGDVRPQDAATHPKRNILTRALGVPEKLEIDLSTTNLRVGDKLLFCSDGLYDCVSPAEIREILRLAPDVNEAVAQLIEATLNRGAPDNVTVIVGFL